MYCIYFTFPKLIFMYVCHHCELQSPPALFSLFKVLGAGQSRLDFPAVYNDRVKCT